MLLLKRNIIRYYSNGTLYVTIQTEYHLPQFSRISHKNCTSIQRTKHIYRHRDLQRFTCKTNMRKTSILCSSLYIKVKIQNQCRKKWCSEEHYFCDIPHTKRSHPVLLLSPIFSLVLYSFPVELSKPRGAIPRSATNPIVQQTLRLRTTAVHQH